MEFNSQHKGTPDLRSVLYKQTDQVLPDVKVRVVGYEESPKWKDIAEIMVKYLLFEGKVKVLVHTTPKIAKVLGNDLQFKSHCIALQQKEEGGGGGGQEKSSFKAPVTKHKEGWSINRH